MSEQHTDPEHVDPMEGSGISEDDYSEASWADDSPLDDPEADQYAEDVRRDGTGEKRKGEQSYDQKVDGRAGGTDEDELDQLARRIRRLEDEQSIRVGVDLDSGAGEAPWGEDDGPRGIQVSKSKPSELLTAEEWVALDLWDDRLGEPFPWEPKARIDQTEAPPWG